MFGYGLTQLISKSTCKKVLAPTRALTRTRERLELRGFLSKSTSRNESTSVDLFHEYIDYLNGSAIDTTMVMDHLTYTNARRMYKYAIS